MESKLIIEKQNLCFEEFKTGKISLGKIHAEEVLSDMVKLKRIASIKTFIKQIRNFGVTDKNISKYEKITEYLQGYSKQNIGQIDWHIDHYKTSKEILKKYLIDCEIWKKKQLHLCYEYILSYGCDIEIENKITEQSLRQHISSENVEKTSKVLEKLNCNYDQIAYELISGSRESTETDEAAIINGLKLIDLETLEIGGKDFVTAFRFLGMEEVVVYICERLLQTNTTVDLRISLYFFMVESLISKRDFFKAYQMISECMIRVPIYGEEKIACIYLKAETCFYLGKKAESVSLYLQVYKENPNYRLVNQRLKLLEAN